MKSLSVHYLLNMDWLRIYNRSCRHLLVDTVFILDRSFIQVESILVLQARILLNVRYNLTFSCACTLIPHAPTKIHSNPLVPNPDALIEGADTVAVGPLYEVQKGDTLLSVAAMAKTTVKSILQVNSDLAVAAGPDHDLLPGYHICLLLCSSMPTLE